MIKVQNNDELSWEFKKNIFKKNKKFKLHFGCLIHIMNTIS